MSGGQQEVFSRAGVIWRIGAFCAQKPEVCGSPGDRAGSSGTFWRGRSSGPGHRDGKAYSWAHGHTVGRATESKPCSFSRGFLLAVRTLGFSEQVTCGVSEVTPDRV